jgi:hypothetical protein
MKSKAELARDASDDELAESLGLLTGMLLLNPRGLTVAEGAKELVEAYKQFTIAVREGERLRINANSN